MTATAPQQKITYTSSNVDMEAFHRAYDAALAEVRAQAGKSYPLYIGGQPVEVPGAEPITDVSPIDTGFILGRFACAFQRVDFITQLFHLGGQRLDMVNIFLSGIFVRKSLLQLCVFRFEFFEFVFHVPYAPICSSRTAVLICCI